MTAAAPRAKITGLEPWLELTKEEAEEPDMAICDAHHHFWAEPGNRYLLDDLLRDMSGGHNIVSTVFVQSNSMERRAGPPEFAPLGETEFANGLAAMSASGLYGAAAIAAAIVPHADMRLGARVAPVLEGHLAIARQRVRGIRHTTAYDVDPAAGAQLAWRPAGIMNEPGFREGVALLARYGLVYETWVYFHQLGELAQLARAVPMTTVVLDHIGSPLGIGRFAGKRAEVLEAWTRGIAELAACDNTAIKLGGLGMPRCGFGWSERDRPPGSVELAEAFAPYYEYCIEHFGPERCMFEANFPPDKRSHSYTVVWNAYKRMTRGYSAGERAALFHDTAARIYRLEPSV